MSWLKQAEEESELPTPYDYRKFVYSITYDIVTPESAEGGDYADSGFALEKTSDTLEEIASDAGNYNIAPGQEGERRHWVSDSQIDYTTAEETVFTLHVENLTEEGAMWLNHLLAGTLPPRDEQMELFASRKQAAEEHEYVLFDWDYDPRPGEGDRNVFGRGKGTLEEIAEIAATYKIEPEVGSKHQDWAEWYSGPTKTYTEHEGDGGRSQIVEQGHGIEVTNLSPKAIKHFVWMLENPHRARQPELNLEGQCKQSSVPGSKDFTYSSVQFAIPDEMASEILKWSEKNIPDDILSEEGDAHGREDYPHVTVKYGIHSESSDESEELLEGEKAFEITLGEVSTFVNDDKPYDVVKIDIESKDLHKLNKKISDNLEATDTHPEYHPHLTLAYVKKGEGEKFVGNEDFKGKKAVVKELEFSSKEKEIGATSISLVASRKQAEGEFDATLYAWNGPIIGDLYEFADTDAVDRNLDALERFSGASLEEIARTAARLGILPGIQSYQQGEGSISYWASETKRLDPKTAAGRVLFLSHWDTRIEEKFDDLLQQMELFASRKQAADRELLSHTVWHRGEGGDRYAVVEDRGGRGGYNVYGEVPAGWALINPEEYAKERLLRLGKSPNGYLTFLDIVDAIAFGEHLLEHGFAQTLEDFLPAQKEFKLEGAQMGWLKHAEDFEMVPGQGPSREMVQTLNVTVPLNQSTLEEINQQEDMMMRMVFMGNPETYEKFKQAQAREQAALEEAMELGYQYANVRGSSTGMTVSLSKDGEDYQEFYKVDMVGPNPGFTMINDLTRAPEDVTPMKLPMLRPE